MNCVWLEDMKDILDASFKMHWEKEMKADVQGSSILRQALMVLDDVAEALVGLFFTWILYAFPR